MYTEDFPSEPKFHKVQNTTGLYRYGSQKGEYARIKIHGKLIVKKLNSNALLKAKIEVSRRREKHGKLKPEKGAKTLSEAWIPLHVGRMVNRS